MRSATSLASGRTKLPVRVEEARFSMVRFHPAPSRGADASWLAPDLHPTSVLALHLRVEEERLSRITGSSPVPALIGRCARVVLATNALAGTPRSSSHIRRNPLATGRLWSGYLSVDTPGPLSHIRSYYFLRDPAGRMGSGYLLLRERSQVRVLSSAPADVAQLDRALNPGPDTYPQGLFLSTPR